MSEKNICKTCKINNSFSQFCDLRSVTYFFNDYTKEICVVKISHNEKHCSVKSIQQSFDFRNIF